MVSGRGQILNLLLPWPYPRLGNGLEEAARMGDVIAPWHLCLYAPPQYEAPGFPFQLPRPSTKLLWAKAFNASANQECLVPASLLFIGYRGPDRSADLNSTGTAAHPEKDEAMRAALLEVIERDALVMLHLGVAPFYGIDPLGERSAKCVHELQSHGYQVRILLIQTDWDIPAADSSLSRAVDRAATEAIRFFRFYRKDPHLIRTLIDTRNRLKGPAYSLGFHQHVRHHHLVDKYFDGGVSPEALTPIASGLDADLPKMISHITSLRYTVIFYHFQLPEAAFYKLHITRCLITHAIPLSFWGERPRSGSKRLVKWPSANLFRIEGCLP